MCRVLPGARAVAQDPEQTVQEQQACEAKPRESWPLLGTVKDPGGGVFAARRRFG